MTKDSSMVTEIEKNIFIIDNFYSEIDQIELLIRQDESSYTYHEGDNAYMFMSRANSNPDIVQKYCSFVLEHVEECFNTKVKTQCHISAIIYPVGGHKGVHVDNFHKDENGVDHDIHLYTATHFVHSPESGGELFFPDFNLHIESRRNRIVIFDAKYSHGSSEVLSGEKISINYFWELDGAQ